ETGGAFSPQLRREANYLRESRRARNLNAADAFPQHVAAMRQRAGTGPSPLNSWSGSAKSPCRGFATRILLRDRQRWSRFLFVPMFLRAGLAWYRREMGSPVR